MANNLNKFSFYRRHHRQDQNARTIAIICFCLTRGKSRAAKKEPEALNVLSSVNITEACIA